MPRGTPFSYQRSGGGIFFFSKDRLDVGFRAQDSLIWAQAEIAFKEEAGTPPHFDISNKPVINVTFPDQGGPWETVFFR